MKYNNLPPSSTALRRFSSVRLEIGVWDGHFLVTKKMGVWSISIYLSLFCCVCENIRNIIRSPYQWYKCTSMIFFCAINAYMYMTLRSFMNCIHGHIQISYVDIYNTNNCACGYIWNLNSIYMHLCNFIVSRLLSFIWTYVKV